MLFLLRLAPFLCSSSSPRITTLLFPPGLTQSSVVESRPWQVGKLRELCLVFARAGGAKIERRRWSRGRLNLWSPAFHPPCQLLGMWSVFSGLPYFILQPSSLLLPLLSLFPPSPLHSMYLDVAGTSWRTFVFYLWLDLPACLPCLAYLASPTLLVLPTCLSVCTHSSLH